jgi:hypothetical protein
VIGGAREAALHKACAQPTFTTRADLWWTLLQSGVTLRNNHGNVIAGLISVPEFLN